MSWHSGNIDRHRDFLSHLKGRPMRITSMKLLIVAATAFAILSLGLTGCSDTTSTKTEKTITSPGGTTKITEEKEVKKTGNNPP
jgi:hypothetical protein